MNQPRGRDPRADYTITANARRGAKFAPDEISAFQAEQNQLILDFQETFSTEHGQRVLNHLEILARRPSFSTAAPDANIAIGRTYKAEMMEEVYKLINGVKR